MTQNFLIWLNILPMIRGYNAYSLDLIENCALSHF